MSKPKEMAMNPQTSKPQTEFHPPALSYWIVLGRFLAGPHPCPDGNTKRLLEILNVGIDTFVSLQPEGERGLQGVKEYERTLQRIAATLNRKVRFLRRPMVDSGVCSPEIMSEILDTIDDLIAAGCNVFLHCWSGLGRTGLVAGCWLVRHGLNGGEALKRIEELRSHDEELCQWSSPSTYQQCEMVRWWNSLSGVGHE
jgi:hypothetical protein